MTLNRIVNVKVLPGQPTDGNGKVCIHLFVQDERGPFVEPAVIHAEDGKLVHKPTRGRLACDPKRIVAAVTHNGITTVTMCMDYLCCDVHWLQKVNGLPTRDAETIG